MLMMIATGYPIDGDKAIHSAGLSDVREYFLGWMQESHKCIFVILQEKQQICAQISSTSYLSYKT